MFNFKSKMFINTVFLKRLAWMFVILLFSTHSQAIQTQTAFTREALLQNAIKAGHIEDVRSLLADGMNVNQSFEDGISPLHIAVINNQEEIVELLMQMGANVNAVETNIGASPLHLAALYGRVNIANQLIRKGANVNGNMKFNITPLLVAAQFNQPQIIELLLNNKANLNHTDQEGFSALHFAAQNGDDVTAKMLLERGANTNARDKTRNATPLMIATEQKHTNVIQLLERQQGT